jgi:hypothetical protein
MGQPKGRKCWDPLPFNRATARRSSSRPRSSPRWMSQNTRDDPRRNKRYNIRAIQFCGEPLCEVRDLVRRGGNTIKMMIDQQ